MESSKASCHSFRATAKRFAELPKHCERFPCMGDAFCSVSSFTSRGCEAVKPGHFLGLKTLSDRYVCASIQRSVCDENHPDAQSRGKPKETVPRTRFSGKTLNSFWHSLYFLLSCSITLKSNRAPHLDNWKSLSLTRPQMSACPPVSFQARQSLCATLDELYC